MTDPATCRCDRYEGHQCAREATQEDLLCDVCGGRSRYGSRCGAVRGFEPGDRYHVGMRFTVAGHALDQVPGMQLGSPVLPPHLAAAAMLARARQA